MKTKRLLLIPFYPLLAFAGGVILLIAFFEWAMDSDDPRALKDVKDFAKSILP